MIPAATILHEGTQHPSPKQGATQTGVEEVTKRFKKYMPYVFSSPIPGSPDRELLDNVWQYRMRLSPLENIATHFINQKIPSFFYLNKIADNIKQMEIKLVHVRNRPLYLPVLRKLLGKDIKLILHEHNQNIADTLSEKQAREVLDSIDAYVAVSQFTHDFEITNKYPEYKCKSRVILNGVNLEKFKPLWENTEKVLHIRRKFGVESTRNILFAGALRERKGVHMLIEAMKVVVNIHPDAKLIIAGGSKDNTAANDAYAKQLFESAAEISNNVVFTGYIPPSEMEDVYMLGDIFCGPSLWDEAFGLVFVEASASGLGVIGSRRGGIPEIIEDGVTGLLINKPEDPCEIAEKIMQMLDDRQLADRFGHAARKRMEEKFSWDRVARQIEELYDELEPKIN